MSTEHRRTVNAIKRYARKRKLPLREVMSNIAQRRASLDQSNRLNNQIKSARAWCWLKCSPTALRAMGDR